MKDKRRVTLNLVLHKSITDDQVEWGIRQLIIISQEGKMPSGQNLQQLDRIFRHVEIENLSGAHHT